MASEQGYSNQKKKGKAQFKTIHSSGSDSFAESVIPKYLYDINLSEIAISSISDVIGSNGQVEFWNIQMPSHNASAGNVLQLVTTSDASLSKFQFDIISIVDSSNFLVLPISNIKPSAADTGLIKGWVSAASDSSGNPQIAIAPAPIKFKLDGVTTDVSKDTVTPANSVPLPVDVTLKDTDDTVALGDGSGNLISVKDTFNLHKALHVFDEENNATLTGIQAVLPPPSMVDSENTTQTPLGSGAIYTGNATLCTGYAAINVCVVSNVPSATNGVTVQFSADGMNWVHSHSTTYAGGAGVGYIFNAEFQYFRVVYTNGATAQTSFTLQTILKAQQVNSSLYTISQTVNGNMFAALGKNVIIGETTGGGGGYVPVKVNPSGALTTEATVSGTVAVSNFPATQPVSGTVAVNNFPATQAVTGTFWQATQPVSGTVAVSNFPATQAVTGTFWQATQPVSGSVSVSNFPATQNTAEQTQSGSITNIQKSVGITAVRATVSGSAPSATRKKLMIKPSKNNSGAIYLGSSSVTISNGLEIIGPDRLEFELDSSDYYLISDTAGQVVEIIEVA